MRKKLALTLLITTAVLALSGCVGTTATPAAVPTPNSTTTVKENGNGRLDPGESIVIPRTVKEMSAVACTITKSGKLTAVNAQQLNGFGQYANLFATQPSTLNVASGITSVADAARVAAVYILLSQHIYNITLKSNIALPSDVKIQVAAICAGDVFAGIK